jgi:uncharacterized protein YcaQ
MDVRPYDRAVTAARESLSCHEARRLALLAQGLCRPRLADPTAMLDHLGAVQLDTISVLARSHLLVAWARLGPVRREAIEAAYWGGPPARCFEYWSRAASIMPIDRWPEFAFRRRANAARGRRWHHLEDAERACRAVLSRLADEGPLTASDLGGAKAGGPWWDWTESKIAVEWLLDIGHVVCTTRRGWRRVYDLTERAIPAALLAVDLDDDACYRRLASHAARALGAATAGEIARHHGLRVTTVAPLLGETGLVELDVEGITEPCWADPAALSLLGRPMRHVTTLLSPFDSLLSDRRRTERLFGFTHRVEAYTPRPARVHGYFPMPLLSGGRLVGRIDPAREADVLVARQVGLAGPGALDAAAAALSQAATWVGSRAIRVETVTPAELRAALVARVS